MEFLNFLVEQKLIDSAKLSEVVNKANSDFSGDIQKALVFSGISEEEILKQKGVYYNIPTKILTEEIDKQVLKYIPEESSLNYKIIPLSVEDNMLIVGIVDPGNQGAISAIQFLASKIGFGYKLFLIKESDFEKSAQLYKNADTEIGRALNEFGESDFSQFDTEKEVETESLQIQSDLKPGEEARIVEDAPIIKIVSSIIRHACEGGASDIHIENTGAQVKVRFRVDGELHTSFTLPIKTFPGVIARIKILAKLRLDEKRKPQDGSFSARINNRKIDFRVSSFPSYYGEKIVLRILDSEKGLKKLTELGMTEANLATVKRALAKPYGLVLLTGPTGSGKTTTLYSMMNELNKESQNVVSLEDPVEYQIPNISQSQVMPEIDYTFASGLRSILRQDPDIIMVGEIRDKETAQLAIQAALTGHLVFSTLHTNNAIGVVPRLIDMGVDPYLIAPTLILAIAQRLVRTTCPNSKKAVPIDESLREQFDKQFSDLPIEIKSKINIGNTIYDAVPSPECAEGTKGRSAVFEMIEIDKDIQKVILTDPTDIALYKIARQKGMLTMKEDAIFKSLKGEIPYHEIYSL